MYSGRKASEFNKNDLLDESYVVDVDVAGISRPLHVVEAELVEMLERIGVGAALDNEAVPFVVCVGGSLDRNFDRMPVALAAFSCSS